MSLPLDDRAEAGFEPLLAVRVPAKIEKVGEDEIREIVITLELIRARDFVQVFAGFLGFDPADGKIENILFAREAEVGRAVWRFLGIDDDGDGRVEVFDEASQSRVVRILGGLAAVSDGFEFGDVRLERHRADYSGKAAVRG